MKVPLLPPPLGVLLLLESDFRMYSKSFVLAKDTLVNVVRFEWTISLNVTNCEVLPVLPDPLKCQVVLGLLLDSDDETCSLFTVATELDEL